MKKLALILAGFGFIAFTGSVRAEETKTENTQKSETSTTLSGKKKTVKSKKVVEADGATTETKTETITPKREDVKRDDVDAKPVRHEAGEDEAAVKTEHHTTLTGKQQSKTTKKVERPDGTSVETTTTTTEPNKK